MKKLRLFLILSILFGAVSAQVPQGFNYQAVARDGTGALLGNTTLQVMLYIQSSPTGGTIFWKELHNPVTTNPFGLFTVVLGTGVRQAASNVTTFDKIDWTVTPKYIKTEIYFSGAWRDMGNAAQLWTVPYAMTAKTIGAGKLNIKGTETDADSVLFEVKRSDGKTVFAVYNEGVRVYVADGYKGSGTRGGFAVGGFDATKASQQYLVVTADSTRIYTNNAAEGKGKRGGFAVGGFDATKATPTLFTSLTTQNYFIGHESGMNTDPLKGGLYNSFFGYQTGRANILGANNVFIGYQSGLLNAASYNVFIGYKSGLSNSDGNYNVFVGSEAGYSNKDGQYNTFLGYQAGYQNIGGANIWEGEYNTFVGYQAGFNSTSGHRNIAIGYRAGYGYTTNRYNICIGEETGSALATGQGNVIIGTYAGEALNSGEGNVLLGLDAGFGTTTGSDNIMLGLASGRAANGSRNVFIGKYSGYGETGNDKLVIENNYTGADNLNNALIYGDFNLNQVKINGSVGINANPGTAKLSVVDDVTSMAVRGETSWSGSADHYGIYGSGAGSTGFNHGVYGSASGGLQAFGIWGTASGASSYNVGVFASASGTGNYAGYFAGNLAYTGTLSNLSDKNLKKNIQPLYGALDKILKVQGVSYLWKSEQELEVYKTNKSSGGKMGVHAEFNFPEGKQIGVIAQDVERVLPELVQTDGDGIKSVDYVKMIPVLIEAMKEQQKMIDDLKAEIDALKKK